MKSLTHFKKRTRQTVALVISTCALALGAFTASAAPDFANVTAVNFRPAGRNFDLTVSILKGLLDAASRTSGADLDVRVTLATSLPRTLSRRSTPDASQSGPARGLSDRLTTAPWRSGLYSAREASGARQPLQHHHGGPSAPSYSLAGQVVVLFLRGRYLSDGSLGVH